MKYDIHLKKIVEKIFTHTFEYRWVFYIKFTNITNKEEVSVTISHGDMKLQSEFYG